uniref:Uncharacterized protein n=1 Tax=Romanomermis culicivorax TaxID=13658 RepID=A0A915K4J2_ROMCU
MTNENILLTIRDPTKCADENLTSNELMFKVIPSKTLLTKPYPNHTFKATVLHIANSMLSHAAAYKLRGILGPTLRYDLPPHLTLRPPRRAGVPYMEST